MGGGLAERAKVYAFCAGKRVQRPIAIVRGRCYRVDARMAGDGVSDLGRNVDVGLGDVDLQR